MEYMRIPRDRIGVLVGPDGATRTRLEERSGCGLEVGSDGMVHVVVPEGGDQLKGLQLRSVVQAVGRGFHPEAAEALLSSEQYLEICDIRAASGRSKKRTAQLRGRVIGRHGKTRHLIEEQTGAEMVIRGHTVALLGELESVEAARVAVDMLLGGAEHASVYRYLEGHRRCM